MRTTSRTRVAAAVVTVALLVAAGRIIWTLSHYFLSDRTGRHRVETSWIVFTAIAAGAVWWQRRHVRVSAAEPEGVAPSGAILFATVLLSFILYRSALLVGLLADDYVLLARSLPETLDITRWEFVRPVPLLLWKFITPIVGPMGLHSLNIVLHGVNAWLLSRLSHHLGGSYFVNVLASVLFLCFPAAVEPVTWNSGIFDVSMVTFGLGYLLMLRSSDRWIVALLLLLLALLSKETAVALPVLALLIKKRLGYRRIGVVLSLILVVAYAMFRLAEPRARGTVVPKEETIRYVAKEVLVRPFASLAVPWTAEELRRWPVLLGIVPSIGLLAVGLAGVLTNRISAEPALYASWAVVGVLPAFGFFFVSDELQGARYLYLPLAGWCLFVSRLIVAVIPRGDLRITMFGGLLLAVSIGGWGVQRHLRPWVETAAIRDRILANASDVIKAHGCGTAHFEGVPAHHEGAYLFVNGFPEALRLGTTTSSGVSHCEFVWTEGAFVRLR